jgi:hypothetical protein
MRDPKIALSGLKLRVHSRTTFGHLLTGYRLCWVRVLVTQVSITSKVEIILGTLYGNYGYSTARR